MGMLLEYGTRQEEDVSEAPESYRTNAPRPVDWRGHQLAYALTEAELALCRALAEQQRANQRYEAARQEWQEAQEAMDPAITAVIQASEDVERAREALVRVMGESEP